MNPSRSLMSEQPAEREIVRWKRLYAVHSQISHVLLRTANRDELLPAVCRLAVEHGELDQAAITWLDPQTGRLVLVSGFSRNGRSPEALSSPSSTGAGGAAPVAKVLREGQPWVANTWHLAADPLASTPATPPCRLGACAWFPLRFQGQICGVLSLLATEAGFFGTREIELFTEVAANLSCALDRCEDNRQRAAAETALRDYIDIDITERQQAKAALERSERNYREIFNSTNEAIFFNDAATGRMLDVNEAMLRLYNCASKAEVLDGNIGDLSANEPPYTEEEAQRRLRLAIEEGPQVFEWLARKKTGEYFWAEVSLRSSQIGGQERVLAVVRDITERKRALDGLREERMFTETLLRSLPGIFYLYSYPELRLVRWNKNHETALGYGPGECQNRSIFEWHPPEAKELVRQAVEEVMSQGEAMLESTLLTKDGRQVPFLMTGSKLEVQGVSYLMGVGIDLSEHKRAEAALRENEARQRAMIANIADVIGIIDQDGINRYKSPNLERWFGWKPEELVGAVTWAQVHPDDQATTQAVFGRLLSAPNATATGQCRYRCKDGAYKWIEFTAVNLLTDPAIRGVLLNYHDITERQRAMQERQRLQEQLAQAQKMESVGRLAGGVAHDFNNMLTAIQGNAALALQDLPPTSPARENLEEIQQCAQRSADLTRQLLAFARKQTVTPKVLDLNDTVMGMLKMLRRLIGEDIELHWSPASGSCLVKIDPSQVDQVLANLCVNARDAISGVGRITLETSKLTVQEADAAAYPGSVPGEYVLLSVSDTGCGMEQEVLEHLFEPFFTTKGLGLGTGLGLATVYGVVQQNDGFISVESQPGRGTTFKIYLPRHADKLAQLPKDGPQHSVAGRGRETVLLVEDEPAILRIGTRALQSLGYTVLAAGTPGEAIRLAAEHAGAIDLLMTDVIMPEMNGRDLAQRLLALYPKLKRLFMSGYTADVIAHRGVLAEGVHFIQKPFNISTLAEKVREALEVPIPCGPI